MIGAIALTGALIFAWRYYADSTHKNRASLWRQFEQASNANELEGIIDSNRGTAIAVSAKAQLARIVMTEGLATLGDPSKRVAAIAGIERARELYEQVVKEAKDDLVLQREAMLGQAKAEESLVGIPKADNPSEFRGSLDRAIELYQQTAEKFAAAPQGKEAADRAKVIKDNKQKIQQFYDDLNKDLTIKDPFADDPHGVPPRPDFSPFDPRDGPLLPPLPTPKEPAKKDPPAPILPPPTITTPPKAETPKPVPPKAETPKPAPPKAETPKPTPPKAETPKPVPPKTEPNKP